MKRFLSFVFLTINLLLSSAQGTYTDSRYLNNQLELRFHGNVIFIDGSSLDTEMWYNPLIRGGLLRVKVDSTIKTLTPKHIKKFSFYDDRETRVRNFYSMKIKDPKYKEFIEVLTKGENFSLVGEETIKIKQNGKVKGKYLLSVIEHSTGASYPLKKKALYQLMSDHKALIKKFMKLEKIYLKNALDAIELFEYYERL